MLHATTDPAHLPNKRLDMLAPALKTCNRLLVHALGDLNRLKALGLVDNVALFPHGVLDWSSTTSAKVNREFIIASYGFFLPQKGLLELIEALKLLMNSGFEVKLKMINAEYPTPESAKLIQEARSKVEALGLSTYIEIISDFLPDQESLNLLSTADLLVFPYQETGESTSGAVRYGLASRKLVAVSPLAIFDDVSRAVFKLPGCNSQEIAEGVERLIWLLKANDETAINKQEEADKWREAHQYSKLGQRLYNMLIALSNQNNNEWIGTK